MMLDPVATAKAFAEQDKIIAALRADLARVTAERDAATRTLQTFEKLSRDANSQMLAQVGAAERERDEARAALKEISEGAARLRDDAEDGLVRDEIILDEDIRQAQAMLALSALAPCGVESLALGLAAARLSGRASMQKERDEARARAEQALAWDDAPLPEDDAIKAAFPTRTDRHDLYAEAMRLVGACRSKGKLVSLVNWLLWRLAAHQAFAEAWDVWRAILCKEGSAEWKGVLDAREKLRAVEAGATKEKK